MTSATFFCAAAWFVAAHVIRTASETTIPRMFFSLDRLLGRRAAVKYYYTTRGQNLGKPVAKCGIKIAKSTVCQPLIGMGMVHNCRHTELKRSVTAVLHHAKCD